MTITSDGRLHRAYQDTCKNYTPDEEKPSGCRSVKLGMIYECKKYDHGTDDDSGCYWCINRAYDITN